MVRTLLSFAVLSLVCAPAFADDPAAPKKPEAAKAAKQEGDKPAKKEGDAAKPAKKKKEVDPTKGPQLRSSLKPIESKVQFTDDQKAKIDALVAELQPKYAEATRGIKLTDEQQAARKAAQEKAKADGLKGEAATKAVQEAMKLSPEQKSAMETQAAVAEEFRNKVRELLTPEQKKSMRKKPAA